MKGVRRWQPCVDHRGPETEQFARTYFADPERKCLLIAGGGFDPRASAAAGLLAATLDQRLSAIIIREERPLPSKRIVAMADGNVRELQRLITNSIVESVIVFDSDGAVVGGRNAVEVIRKNPLEGVTDVVIDMSALSIGVSFPIVRYVLEFAERSKTRLNVHVMVLSAPYHDEQRVRVSNDVVSLVHSFHGDLKLHSRSESAKLWIPQLSVAKQSALERIYAAGSFDDVCPILPFPSSHARAGEAIAEHFMEQLDGAWEVDARNIVYACEDDPVDVYRTILDIEEQRRPVFEGTVKSVVVLSPVGSKAVALGSLMAAVERSLPVVYVEALKYDLPAKETPMTSDEMMLHVWLHGEAYSEAEQNR